MVRAKKGRPAPPWNTVQTTCLGAGRDLGNGRAAHLVAQNFRSPLDDVAKGFQHFRVGSTAVLLGLVLRLPEADRVGLVPVGADEGDLVLKPWLLAQDRKNFLLQ